jgi:predicted RNase H-like nuclease (RuvC/YqgF family)
LRRKLRYKRVNGVKVPYTEVTINENVLNDLVEAVSCPARVKQNYEKLQTLGAQLKRETSQTAIYKRCVEAEAQIKQLKTEIMLLEAQIRDRDREIAEMQTQGAEPYIDYEYQTVDLEL